jgi:DNA-binding PadR family transcriptional regulator
MPHPEDYASPVAPYLVLLLLLEERGPLSTTRLARAAAERTSDTYGGHLTPTTTTLARLEREGVLTSSHPDPRRSTRVWSLTEDGQWFLDEARTIALLALGVSRRRKGAATHGNAQAQRQQQRQRQRR